MGRWYSLISPEIHAIVLVVEVGRFTEEDQKTVEFVMKTFGEELIDFLIVAFTHKDRLDKENMTVEYFVQTLDKSSNPRRLIDACKSRYTAIGYNGNTEDRIMEVTQILFMIEKMKKKDRKNFNSNEMFQRVQEILEEKESSRNNCRTFRKKNCKLIR